MKYSFRDAYPSWAAYPESTSTSFCTIEEGISNGSSFLSFNTCVIIPFQIGAAPVIPDARFGCIGLSSLFPTQKQTTYEGVYPTVQLSFLSSVVPVLTATVFPGILRTDLVPNT